MQSSPCANLTLLSLMEWPWRVITALLTGVRTIIPTNLSWQSNLVDGFQTECTTESYISRRDPICQFRIGIGPHRPNEWYVDRVFGRCGVGGLLSFLDRTLTWYVHPSQY